MADALEPFNQHSPLSPAGGAIAAVIIANLDLHERAAKLARPAIVRKYFDAPDIVQCCPSVREQAWRKLTPEHRERAERRLKIIPDRMELQRQYDDLHDAVFRQATEADAHVIFAAMLDGLPAGAGRDDITPITTAYLATLQFAPTDDEDDDGLRAFSTRALASASVRIWSENRFTPAPSEVLKAARAARKIYLTTLRVTERVNELRAEADAVLEFEDEAELAAILRGERDDDPESIPF